MSDSFLIGVAVGTVQTLVLADVGAWLKRRLTWGRLNYTTGPTFDTRGGYIYMAWRDRFVSFRR